MEALLDAPKVPVARVAVDIEFAHLDRLFDYLIDEDAGIVPGIKVQVKFSGQLRYGWVIELGEREADPSLQPIHKVVSTEVVLTPSMYRLLRSVADHYAGTLSSVVRQAIPSRHAGTEKAEQKPWPEPKALSQVRVLPGFPAGESFLQALREGRHPRAAWLAPAVSDVPGDVIGGVIEAVDATVRGGRGAVVVVPTQRELDAALPRFQQAFGVKAVAKLSGEMGVSSRYRNFLAAVRGEARVVVGTRSAIYAPVHDLGLLVVVDDGHDGHAALHAPYPHSRDVAVLRSAQESCALLFAGCGRSVAVQALIERGWVKEIQLTPSASRRICPAVRATTGNPSRDPVAARLRIPTEAFELLRDALRQGSVLVQVPRAGVGAALQCARCRNRALCQHCQGPLRSRVHGRVECAYCGFSPALWQCLHCAGQKLRMPIVGASRTAEELARAFPGTPAVNSSADRIRTSVPDHAIVVATPGAEPVVPEGYAAAVILDVDVMLGRFDMRVVEESMRRWLGAIRLVRPAADGGTALLVGETTPAVQSLLLQDIPGFARRELAEREAAGLPPARRVVRVSGDPQAVADFLDNDEFPGAEILGPTTIQRGKETTAIALLRAPLSDAATLAQSVKNAASVRSARKEGGRLTVETDPNAME